MPVRIFYNSIKTLLFHIQHLQHLFNDIDKYLSFN